MDTEAQNITVFLGKHADKILVLMQSGFFDMASGSVTCHFDPTGTIKKVEKHYVINVV